MEEMEHQSVAPIGQESEVPEASVMASARQQINTGPLQQPTQPSQQHSNVPPAQLTVAQPMPTDSVPAYNSAHASAALAAAAAIPGAIPVQVMGSMPGMGGAPVPGMTQVIIAAPAPQQQPAQLPAVQPAPSQMSQMVSTGMGDSELEVTSRVASYGPGYMNMAFDPASSGARHNSFTYFAGATGAATTQPIAVHLPPRPRYGETAGHVSWTSRAALTGLPCQNHSCNTPCRAVSSPEPPQQRHDAQAAALEAQLHELSEQNQ